MGKKLRNSADDKDMSAKCPFCGEEQKLANHLKRHVETWHAARLEEFAAMVKANKKPSSREMVECECRVFVRRSALSDHLKSKGHAKRLASKDGTHTNDTDTALPVPIVPTCEVLEAENSKFPEEIAPSVLKDLSAEVDESCYLDPFYRPEEAKEDKIYVNPLKPFPCPLGCLRYFKTLKISLQHAVRDKCSAKEVLVKAAIEKKINDAAPKSETSLEIHSRVIVRCKKCGGSYSMGSWNKKRHLDSHMHIESLMKRNKPWKRKVYDEVRHPFKCICNKIVRIDQIKRHVATHWHQAHEERRRIARLSYDLKQLKIRKKYGPQPPKSKQCWSNQGKPKREVLMSDEIDPKTGDLKERLLRASEFGNFINWKITVGHLPAGATDVTSLLKGASAGTIKVEIGKKERPKYKAFTNWASAPDEDERKPTKKKRPCCELPVEPALKNIADPVERSIVRNERKAIMHMRVDLASAKRLPVKKYLTAENKKLKPN